jgi:membrane associated rhomboid family serine protease
MFLAVPLYDDAPLRRTPVVTYGIISLCVLVFLWQLGLTPGETQRTVLGFGMVPAVLFGHARLPPGVPTLPPYETVLTSMFLHGGWAHLIGNMLYLWIFGKAVESALGSVRFTLLYLLSGVAAALTQGLMDPTAQTPMIGASGAIAGILGAYLLLFPRGNVVVFFWLLIFIRLITVPAVVMLGLWFLMQLLSATSSNEPGVAFWAHVGGFLAGMALVLLLRPPGAMLLSEARSRAFRRPPPASRPRGPWGPWD